MVIRDISRQSQSVPEEYPNAKDHLRIMARAVNSLIKHQALHPRDVPATVSATYTMVDSDTLILCKADNPITVFLLTAAGREGKQVTIKKIDAGATPVIIDAKDAETIDGALTATLTAQYSFITPKSDNTNWWSVAQRADVGVGSSPSGGALELISEVVTSSSQADVTFSSISSAYRDLEIRVRARGTQAATEVMVRLQFNADTGNNYDYQQTFGGSAAATVAHAQATSFIATVQIPAASATASFVGAMTATIYDYRSSTRYKEVITHGGQSFTTQRTIVTSGQWRSTSAITSVKVYVDLGAIVDGSVVSLYGHM